MQRRLRGGKLWLVALMTLGVTASGCPTRQVRLDGPPVFYPGPPAQPRFQFLRSISHEHDLDRPGAFEEWLLGKPDKPRGLAKPYGVTMRGRDVYVADSIMGTVVKIDLETARFEPLVGARGEGALRKPINVFLSPDDQHLWVADVGRGQVVEYDDQDRFVRALGEPNTMRPTDVAVRGKRVFVCDVAHSRVVVLSRADGRQIAEIGHEGKGDGAFYKPTNLALAPDGSLYVTDTMHFRVQHFSEDGKFLAAFGSAGRGYGQFMRPKGLAVDPAGRVYVVDAAFENVQVFRPKDYRLLVAIGGGGNGPGDMVLPADVEIVTDSRSVTSFQSYVDPRLHLEFLVLVTNQYGPHRLNIYGYGTWRGEAPAAPANATPDAKDEAPSSEPAPSLESIPSVGNGT